MVKRGRTSLRTRRFLIVLVVLSAVFLIATLRSLPQQQQQRIVRKDEFISTLSNFQQNEEIVNLEQMWIHSNYSGLSDCVKRIIRPRSRKEMEFVVNVVAKGMIRKEFNSGFLEILKGKIQRVGEFDYFGVEDLEARLAFVVTPKDFFSVTREHMKSLAELFPKYALVYVVPFSYMPARERDTLIQEAKFHPNVLLADWPCSPVDRHHGFKSYATYFVPDGIEFLLHLNNDVFFQEDGQSESFEESLFKAVKAIADSGCAAMNVMTGERFQQSLNFKGKTKIHNVVRRLPRLNWNNNSGPDNENQTRNIFLVYEYVEEAEKENLLRKSEQCPFIEDHAVLVRSSFSRILFDPSVSDEKEMYSLGLISFLYSSNGSSFFSPVQYHELESRLVFRFISAAISSPETKWDWSYFLMHRLDFRNARESTTALETKFGLNIYKNKYNVLFAEKIMSGARFDFSNSTSLKLTDIELIKMKASLILVMLASFGFTHFRVSEQQRSQTFKTAYELLSEMYTQDKLLFDTVESVKAIEQPDRFQNLKYPDDKIWSRHFIASISRVLGGNGEAFKLHSNGVLAYSPTFVDPQNPDAPSILSIQVKVMPYTYQLRKWLENGVASLVFSLSPNLKEYWIHLRFYSSFSHQKEYHQKDTSTIGKQLCLISETSGPNNEFVTFSKLPTSKFPWVDYQNTLQLIGNHKLTSLLRFKNSTEFGNKMITIHQVRLVQYAPCTRGVLKNLNWHLKHLITKTTT
jgi:preprotein translocase subunit YajC